MLIEMTSDGGKKIPRGKPRITLPLDRLPWFWVWTIRAARCGGVPERTRSKNREDVGPNHSGRCIYPLDNFFIRSSSSKRPQKASDSATAPACSVSSVTSPRFRKWRPPGRICVSQTSDLRDPSKGAPNASPTASPTSDPACRIVPDINLTNKIYLSYKKRIILEKVIVCKRKSCCIYIC